MGIIGRLLGGRTFIYRMDMGNGLFKKRVREDDNFLRFNDKGTIYLVLKTVPPRMDKNGNRHYFMYETDVHTFNIETGEVLDKTLEKEFKERLKLNEVQKFKDMMKDIEEEAIRERAETILESWSIGEEIEPEKLTDEEKKIFEISAPVIKLSKTAEAEIDVLTPHDTINEVSSMILDGKVLTALMNAVEYNKWLLLGVMSVGSALTIIFAVLVVPRSAATFPTSRERSPILLMCRSLCLACFRSPWRSN